MPPLGPLGASLKGHKGPRKATRSQTNNTKAPKPKTPSDRKYGPKKGNPQHARYEEKCGLEEVIGLLYPHLVGVAVVGGDPFPCPLPMHRDGDARQMRLTVGRKVAKPYWKCGAGCCKDKHNDTIDFLRSALGIPYPKAITLWAKLAAAAPSRRRLIIETAFPNFYPKGAAA